MNNRRHPDGRAGSGDDLSCSLDYKTFADPFANRVVGSITGSLIAGRDGGDNAAGESTLGDVIADAQLRGDEAVGLRRLASSRS